MKLNSDIKGIFLDIGWTMCRPKSGHWWLNEAFYRAVDQAALKTIPQEQWNRALEQGHQLLLKEHRMDTEEQEWKQFFDYYALIAEQLPALGLTEDKIRAVTDDQVYNDENYIFFDDVAEALERLKPKYRLGVISDTWPSLRRVLRNAGLTDYFDSITFSFELGVFKPHDALYQDALQKLKLTGQETIFIDDTPLCLQGAENNGILPIQINRPGKERIPSKFACIETFEQLC